MNTDYSYSRRQLLSLAAVFFLAPALRLVPGGSAAAAGRAAWVSVLLALPPLAAYAYFLSRFLACRKEGENMAQLFLRCLGPVLGKALLTALALWFILYAGFMLRSGAARIILTIYPNSSAYVFIIPMGLLALYAALGPARTLVRSGRIFLPLVIGVLLLVLLFASFAVEKENLLPLTVFDLPGAALGALATVDVAVIPIYVCCFMPQLHREDKGDLGALLLWLLAMMGLLFWMNTDIIGCFGAELTEDLSQPFFILVRNLVFFRSLERVEAFVVSLWIFSDFILVAACFFAAAYCLRLVLGKRTDYHGEARLDMKDGRFVIWLCGLASLLLALTIGRESDSFRRWSEIIIPIINLSVAFLLLPTIYIIGKGRKNL